MEKIIETWRHQFFIPILQYIVVVTTLTVSPQNKKKYKILKYFPVYSLALLLVYVSSDTYYIATGLNYRSAFFLGLSDYIDYLFTVLEMAIFSHFYYQLIINRVAKKSIILANIFFLSFFLYMAFEDKEFYQTISENTQTIIYTTEAVLLLLICSFYFVELFKKLPFANLKNEPAFWISAGLLFFLVCTLPYSFLENYLAKNFPEYFFMSDSIFHFFYIVLFFMITRAYLCTPEKPI